LSDGEDFVCERKNIIVYALLILSQCKDLRTAWYGSTLGP